MAVYCMLHICYNLWLWDEWSSQSGGESHRELVSVMQDVSMLRETQEKVPVCTRMCGSSGGGILEVAHIVNF